MTVQAPIAGLAPLWNEMRVVVVDDHEFMREGLRAFLQSLHEDTYVEDVGSVAALVALLAGQSFDLVLLDWHLPGTSGVDALSRIFESATPPKVIVISADGSFEAAQQALAAGAAGFVLKASASQVLAAAIQLVLLGERYVPSHLVELLQPRPATSFDEAHSGLSPRQMEVLAALACGDSSQAIAKALSLSESTVRAHIAEICRRLGVETRLQASQTELAQRLRARRFAQR